MSKNINPYLNKGLNIFFNIFSIKNIYAHKYIFKIIFSEKFFSIKYYFWCCSFFFEVISISLLLIIKFLSSGNLSSIDIKSYKFINELIVNISSHYSFKNIFFILLISAFLFQFLQSIALYINKLMAKYIEARCLSEVTALVHKKILNLKFPVVSNFKIGDLSNYVNQCPLTIRIQIENITSIFIASLISLHIYYYF